jgi:uncharacterized protein
MPDEQRNRLLDAVPASRWNATIPDRFGVLGLNGWWLTAGCVAQSVWNVKYGMPPEHGIVDYDLFYFEPDMAR